MLGQKIYCDCSLDSHWRSSFCRPAKETVPSTIRFWGALGKGYSTRALSGRSVASGPHSERWSFWSIFFFLFCPTFVVSITQPGVNVYIFIRPTVTLLVVQYESSIVVYARVQIVYKWAARRLEASGLCAEPVEISLLLRGCEAGRRSAA